MKKILRNWKKYITEQEKAGKLVIYCDMDGVLTDFGSTMLNILRKEIKTPCQRNKQFAKKFRDLYGADFVLKRHHMLPDTEYKYIRDMMFNIMNNNSKFWASLPWTDDGKQLWNFLKQFNPCILTAPPDWAAIEGKKQWIRRELGISMSRCFFEEEKYIYASPSALLIDDFKSKTEPFIANGGQAIHHTDAKNTIENLKKLIQQNKVR